MRIIVVLVCLLLLLAAPARAALQWFAGAETGDTAECVAVNGTQQVADNTTAATGGWSYKMAGSTNGECQSKAAMGLTTLYASARVKTNQVCVADCDFAVIWVETTGGSWAGGARIFYQASSAHYFVRLYDGGTLVATAATNTDFSIFHQIEYQYVQGSGANATGTIFLDGTQILTTSSGTSTALGDRVWFGNEATSGVLTGSQSIWLDDLHVSTTRIGNARVLARQIAANGNYNLWSYSTGTLLSGVIDHTPVGVTGTNVNTATAANKFSGTVDFTLTGGTGSTGFGAQVVGSSDLILGYKLGGYGRTASVTTDGADSTIFRTGGADTTTALAAWTAGAAPGTYAETYLASPPTAAQVRSSEAGISKGIGTNLHSIYSLWAMVSAVLSSTNSTRPPTAGCTPMFWDGTQWQCVGATSFAHDIGSCPAETSPVNPVSNGADPTGAADSSTAIGQSLTTGDIFFGTAGTYQVAYGGAGSNNVTTHGIVPPANRKIECAPGVTLYNPLTTASTEAPVFDILNNNDVICGCGFKGANNATPPLTIVSQDIELIGIAGATGTIIEDNTFAKNEGNSAVSLSGNFSGHVGPTNTTIRYNSFTACPYYSINVDGQINPSGGSPTVFSHNYGVDCTEGPEFDSCTVSPDPSSVGTFTMQYEMSVANVGNCHTATGGPCSTSPGFQQLPFSSAGVCDYTGSILQFSYCAGTVGVPAVINNQTSTGTGPGPTVNNYLGANCTCLGASTCGATQAPPNIYNVHGHGE